MIFILYITCTLLLGYYISITNDMVILQSLKKTHYIEEIIPFCTFNVFRNDGLIGGIHITDNAYLNFFAILTLTIIALLIIFYYLIKTVYTEKSLALKIAIICILSGGISNVIERYKFSGVLDYIQCQVPYMKSIIFNLGDVFICAGIVMLILLNFKLLIEGKSKNAK